MHDAVIVSEPAMDQLDRDGIVNPESRVRLASTGIGVAVRDGAPVARPLDAGRVQAGAAGGAVHRHGDPMLPNQSGEKWKRFSAKAGILDALKPKLRIVRPGRRPSADRQR